MKILVTGLGVTGKSSFLRWLTAQYAKTKEKFICLDLDYERAKLPKKFASDIIYILEDVHGPTPKAVIQLSEFDLVYYLLPSGWTHLLFWLSRMRIWFANGRFAWDPDIGEKGAWAGSGKPHDLANLKPIFKYFWPRYKKRKAVIKEDLAVLKSSGIATIIITPQKGWSKISFYGPKIKRSS